MTIRPYHASIWLLQVLAVPAWRLAERPRGEFRLSWDRIGRWASIGRSTPEELDSGVAHRYQALAGLLPGVRDAGYFSEKDRTDLWSNSSTPEGHRRIERYYMAQAILTPILLRFDELRAQVVIDCATAEQARSVLDREGLIEVRNFGGGLILARPEP